MRRRYVYAFVSCALVVGLFLAAAEGLGPAAAQWSAAGGAADDGHGSASVTWMSPGAASDDDIGRSWLGIIDRDEDDARLHEVLLEDDLTDLSAWFDDAPISEAGETDAHVLPQMGIIFYLDEDDDLYSCSGVVPESPTGDRVLTAAHCIDGATGPMVFVPDYHRGQAPYGWWTVEAVARPGDYGLTGLADQAVLKVQTKDEQTIADAVGALPVDYDAPPTLGQVVLAGYPAETREARLCRADSDIYDEDGDDYPDAICDSMPPGVSGGPWLTRDGNGAPLLLGITGGAQDGGGYTDGETVAVPMTSAYTRALLDLDLSSDLALVGVGRNLPT